MGDISCVWITLTKSQFSRIMIMARVSLCHDTVLPHTKCMHIYVCEDYFPVNHSGYYFFNSPPRLSLKIYTSICRKVFNFLPNVNGKTPLAPHHFFKIHII